MGADVERRAAAWWGALAVLSLASGCAEEDTRIQLSLPDSAIGDVDEIRLRLWVGDGAPPGAAQGTCEVFSDWLLSTCGRECADVEAFSARDGTAFHDEVLPVVDGRIAATPIDLDQGVSWTVLAVARIAGADTLYDCEQVSSRDEAVLRLHYPPCAARSCERTFHPGCSPRVMCAELAAALREGGDDALSSPPCEATADRDDDDVVAVWAQDGAPCPPPLPPGTHFGTCRLEVVRCRPGETEPMVRGTCPSSREEPCVGLREEGAYDPRRDFDCDQRHPICADTGVCEPGALSRCGNATGCVGETLCSDAGDWEPCKFGGSPELCNGQDDDCDEVVDESIVDCNFGRALDAPRADGCVLGECRCGRGAPCRELEACCDGVCVRIFGDPRHCGACRRPCDVPREHCIEGECRAPPRLDAGPAPDAGRPDGRDAGRPVDVDAGPREDEDAGALVCREVAQCNVDRGDTAPRASACTGGRCLCGDVPACGAESMACCRERCVDILDDPNHCGECERPCERPRVCARGRCVLP